MDISEIKYERLSEPERFLLDIFDGLEEYVHDDIPDIIIYKKDNMVMFEYDPKKQYLWYSYTKIGEVFHVKMSVNFYDTTILVQSMMGKYLNMQVEKTHPYLYHSHPLVNTDINLKKCIYPT